MMCMAPRIDSSGELRSQTAPELDRKRVDVVEEEPEAGSVVNHDDDAYCC